MYAACAVSPPSLCPSAGIYNHPHVAEEYAIHSGTNLVSRGEREKALDHRTTLVQLHRKCCGEPHSCDMEPGTGASTAPEEHMLSPIMAAGFRCMRKVVILQTAMNLQETKVCAPLLPPVCMKQAGPWWAEAVWDTGIENIPECTEDSAKLRGQNSLCHQTFTSFSGKGSQKGSRVPPTAQPQALLLHAGFQCCYHLAGHHSN